MPQTQYLIIAYLVLINIIAIVLMWHDKIQSKRKGNRIPEKTLLFFALFGGALGSYIGMLSVRHKTNKPEFTIGVPFMLFINLVCLYYLLKLI